METAMVNGGRSLSEGSTCNEEVLLKCSSEGISTNRSTRAKSVSHLPGTKMNRLPRSKSRASLELSSSDMEIKDQFSDESSKLCLFSFLQVNIFLLSFLLSFL